MMNKALTNLYGGAFHFVRPTIAVASVKRQSNTAQSTPFPQTRPASTSSERPQTRSVPDSSALLSTSLPSSGKDFSPSAPGRSPSSTPQSSNRPSSPPPDWDENPDYGIQAFSELPSTNFGVNQHIEINREFREALRLIIWQFRAPVRYAFAYGSGVFPQTASSSSGSSLVHPNPPKAITEVQAGNGKMIDFIFGVSFTQHWHSLNLQQHRDHYSSIGSLGSSFVSRVQDKWGAGVYFNPYVTVNGTLIKYGVVNLDTLYKDLSEWNTLYLAGRLQKPVKILRDDPRIRLANQINLISALRTALLLLPETFTEQDLYKKIAGISYLGDPRMSLGAEDLNKVSNIVKHQLPNFRRLYAPLIENLPNVSFQDQRCDSPSWMEDSNTNATLGQDMHPEKRGNMVRRLPKLVRDTLYFRFQSKFQVPQPEFDKMIMSSDDDDSSRVRRKQGGFFEKRVAAEDPRILNKTVTEVLKDIIRGPSYSQSFKSGITAGFRKTARYLFEKWQKNREGRRRKTEPSDEGEKS